MFRGPMMWPVSHWGPGQLVWTCFSRALSSHTSWRTLGQEVRELLVRRLDKHRLLPQVWGQVTVRVGNGMIGRHRCKTHQNNFLQQAQKQQTSLEQTSHKILILETAQMINFQLGAQDFNSASKFLQNWDFQSQILHFRRSCQINALINTLLC